MIQILENIYASKIPADAHSLEKEGQFLYYKADFWDIKNVGRSKAVDFEFEIIGTLTSDEIDFDVEPYCDVVFELPKSKTMGRLCTNLRKQKKSYTEYFRSALTAAGIKQYDKLVILRKL